MGEARQTGQKRQWRTRLLMAAGVFLVALVVALVVAVVFACWLLGIHSREDLLVYRCLTWEGAHPIWKDLALRRIRLGDNLAETTRLHPPRRRDDFGPYTALLYREGGSLDTIWICAENGALISAYVRSSCGTHVFFQSRAHMPAFRSAWSHHIAQIDLESEAWRIHRAISAGQDVFLSDRIQRRELPHESENDQDYMRQLTQMFGAEYAKMMLTHVELTVEISQVLYGDLKEGTTLTFSGEDCSKADLAEPPTVFLHVEDRRILYPDYEAGELYLTVRSEVLEWYQSLTPEQIKDLEARCLARQATLRPGN